MVKLAKQQRPDCDIIVMTAYPYEFPYVEVVQAGASDFIEKPHPSQEMCAKMLRIFGEREMREELRRERQRAVDDMEAIRALQAARAIAEEKYGRLFELSMNGMLVIEPNTFIVDDVNQAFCELCGRPQSELLGHPMSEFIVPLDAERFLLGCEAMSMAGKGAMADIRLLRPNGEEVWLDISVTFIQSRLECSVLLVCKDVTEQHAIEDQLVRMASRDELTGLLNQRAFYSRLDGAIATALWQGSPLSLVFIDLDNFKQCNDTLGHQTGDAVLNLVGRLIRQHLRGADEGFRYGGDEFALLMSGANRNSAVSAAQRLRAAFLETNSHGVSMSCGVAEFRPGIDAKHLVKAADDALYHAKSSGKDTVRTA